MPSTRQLVAILFTDIEGYSALMQENEEKALAVKDRHRHILQQYHNLFNGRVIQYYGDGTLSIFQSAVQAVKCALAMQCAYREERRVPVRMGLHIGDILINDEHVFGDGVNVASRIESLGVAGAVLMSDKVKDEINNQPDLKTRSVGSYQFKNILRKVEVFALVHDALVIPGANVLKGKTEKQGENGKKEAIVAPVKSIAVLPFVNMSNDPDQEYFSDGVSEEIINSLTHLKELKVAGRMSSFQFKNSTSSLREVGEKLGVNSVLEGSVRKQGNKIRITAQLVNVEDGFHLWSEKYDRTIDDVFAIQDEIATAVTDKLKVILLKNIMHVNGEIYVPKIEAYELLLKGRFYLARRGTAILKAIDCFRQAIEIDPQFALAHAAHAVSNVNVATYGLKPPIQVVKQARNSAMRAIKLNPLLADPYCALGYYYNFLEWNWPKAKENYIKSIELNPNYAEAHYRYGLNYLVCAEGKFEEALRHSEQSIKIEPLSAVCYGNHSIVLYTAGRFREALEACRTGIELDANAYLCYLNAGCSHLALKEYDEAIISLETALRISNRHHFSLNGLIWTYSTTGETEKARLLMDELKERSKSEYIAKTFTGLSAAYMGDLESAFAYLELAYVERDPILLLIRYADWVPKTLRSDPRFTALLERIESFQTMN